ncbi:MAG: PDZ domain-containing protein [Muribaculaceae bacterium]|nr:PDZ domain-containing protein [Muribaculaceae bacterium]
MRKIILSAAFVVACTITNAAETPLWLRNAKISPDGSRIAFTYKGDIFTVPTTGGVATRITAQPTYETAPVWSPDSKTLAFASDRFGNFDVFITPADGKGEWTQLTFNSASETPEAFTPSGKAVLFSAAIQDPASSALFPTGRMTELYSVTLDGAAPQQLLATPAMNVSWAPDGKSFLYQDVKGFENNWRKHHTSSVTRDIRRYTPATGADEVVIDVLGEDLWPVDGGDYIYWVAERKPAKSLNVYRAPASNPAAAEKLTSFNRHPVRFLSRADNGTLAFTYDGELYTMAPSGKPAKVAVEINADFPDETVKNSATRGGSSVTPSPDGKNIAFIYRGDVYVTPVEYSTTKQISNTPQAEGHVVWGDDSTLYYDSRRDGAPNIYRATRAISSEPDLAHATVIKEEPVFTTDKHERIKPLISPDGKKMAFILDRNILAVRDMKSGKVHQLTDGSTFRHRNGGFSYSWSPDSKWLALEIVDRQHDPYTDIALVNVETGELTNLTNSGYFDENPKWVFDGNAIAFASERLGMRNHASWGSQMDVFAVFLNDKAYDEFKLSKEERELLPKKNSADTLVNVQLDGMDRRIARLTPMSTDLIDYYIDKDGKKLTYTSDADGSGAFIWEYDLLDGDLAMKRRHSERAGFDLTPDGKNVFLIGRTPYKYGATPKAISYNATMTLDPAAEREFMLDYVERETRERFYTADMNGVDWTGLVKDYRKFLPHISNNYDFAELLSELLGELNVSHTGGRYAGRSATKAPENTASLGVLLDMNYPGPGARIAETLAHGPLSGLASAGDIITAINGTDVTTRMPLDRLLSDASGHRTLVSLQGADGSKRDVTVRPISKGKERDMLYDRWVAQRAHDVDSLSGGRLGYVHISSMDDESFRKVYSDLLGKYNDREGVVIDIRWNGGGRLHEDIEVLLSGEKYFTQEIRGNATCDMPSRRWNKPSIMLMSEACYSNAHGTPWVYSHRGLGKLVGMPVAGTMTSVNWVTMQDPTMVFGIPVVAYRLADGSILENQQLEPDIKVANEPADIVAGVDTQLRAAVTELLREIDAKKRAYAPQYHSREQ